MRVGVINNISLQTHIFHVIPSKKSLVLDLHLTPAQWGWGYTHCFFDIFTFNAIPSKIKLALDLTTMGWSVRNMIFNADLHNTSDKKLSKKFLGI